jgi:polyhydroxybutyrate depolymerase
MGTLIPEEIEVAGVTRPYRLHRPEACLRLRLCRCCSSSMEVRSTAAAMERRTRFSRLADREHVIVVYPQGLSNHWNDGRDPDVSVGRAPTWDDDAASVGAMTDELASRKGWSIAKRVYANGALERCGIFSHNLAARLPIRITGNRWRLAGGPRQPVLPVLSPGAPVSVLILHGTEDPFARSAAADVHVAAGAADPDQGQPSESVGDEGDTGAPATRTTYDLADTDRATAAAH